MIAKLSEINPGFADTTDNYVSHPQTVTPSGLLSGISSLWHRAGVLARGDLLIKALGKFQFGDFLSFCCTTVQSHPGFDGLKFTNSLTKFSHYTVILKIIATLGYSLCVGPTTEMPTFISNKRCTKVILVDTIPIAAHSMFVTIVR